MAMGEEITTVAASNHSTNRIFIGGLSATVTALDLEKTFSSLGKVQNVEIVHSDGRSFAFMDFEPKSDRDMAKLFAVYNGCAWKGGKLRLEKAKEHYLTRLKREWEEDANISEHLDVNKSLDHSDKSLTLNQANTKLQIFFPKLRKAKSVPFKGTGKHKYSFRRVEVPSLPVHFCDCEEHCGPSETANETYYSALSSAAYEKERSITTSVMNKLLEKEENKVPESGTRSISVEAIYPSDNDIHLKQTEEVQEEDADNLVTNIGLGNSDDMLMQLMGKKTHSADQVQESRTPSRSRPSTDGLPRNKEHSKKRQKTASTMSENTLSQAATVASEYEFSSVLSRGKDFKDSKEKELSAEDSPGENQTEHATTIAMSTATNTWMQKSSWRELVGESGNSTFSILNLLPDISLQASKLPNAKDLVPKSSAAPKKRISQSSGEGSTDVKVKKNVDLEKTKSPSIASVPGNGSSNETLPANLNDGAYRNNHQEQRSIPNISIGQVCTFMRSAESEKQWLKAKSALSGYLNKNTKDRNASKDAKAKPPRR